MSDTRKAAEYAVADLISALDEADLNIESLEGRIYDKDREIEELLSHIDDLRDRVDDLESQVKDLQTDDR